jgi:hypothetical protein
MKSKAILLAAVVSAACAVATPARAEDLLDLQLGPPPAAPEKPQPAKESPAAKPPVEPAKAGQPAAAPKPPTPRTADIVSPDAAKAVDDQDLIRELTQPGNDKPDPQKVEERMKAMLARMNDSAALLKKKEAGDLTQETQRRIVMDLDVMIELAKQQQQQGGGQQQPQPGQQRQPGQPGPQGNGPPGGSSPATTDDTHGGQSDAVTGDLRNRDPANWGGLPPRDRDEISHGATEEYLSAYRAMIDRYYQALAEMGKNRNR